MHGGHRQVGQELRVVCGEQRGPTALPGNRGQRVVVLRAAGDTRTGTAVGVAHQNAALLVDLDIHEVEQVAVGAAGGSAGADRTALNRVVRRRVAERPGTPGVVG